MSYYELAALAATSVLLIVCWFVFIESSFDQQAFTHETTTGSYVLFIGTFTYVALMHATTMFIDASARVPV